jgi:iron-sulfur cluster assembly accessory protein
MVTITERAAAKLKELLEAEGDPSLTALRVAVEGGGCSGFQYALGFDSEPEDGDAVAELHGVRILVDRYSLPISRAPGSTTSTASRAPGSHHEPERRGGVRLRQLVQAKNAG